MPDTKITALTAIGANPIIPATFPIPMVDLTDTSMAASGTTKKVTVNQILGAGGTATLASATITGDLTVGTGAFGAGQSGGLIGNGKQVVFTNNSGSNSGWISNADNACIYSSGAGGAFAFNGHLVLQPRGSAAGAILFGTGNGAAAMAERYKIDSTGIATWSNVGGVAGTAMTLNSTGLGIGVTPSAWGGAFKAVDFGTVGGMAATGVATRFTHNSYNNGTNFIYKASSVAACLYELNAGEHRWFTAPSGTAGNAITFTQAMTLDASGNLLAGVASANANGGVLQLKSGITFPATQVASSDVNTLDDYEEGSWVPTLNSGTFSSASCRFTKIGNMVTIFFDVTVGTGGGDRITNLPFAAASTSTVANGIYTNNQTYAAGTTAPVVVVGGSSSTLFFRTVGTGVAFSAMTLTAAANLTGSISYFV